MPNKPFDQLKTYLTFNTPFLWPSVIYVSFIYMMCQVIKQGIGWVPLGVVISTFGGSQSITLPFIASIFGLIFLLFLVFGANVLFVKKGASLHGIRSLTSEDLGIDEILKTGFSWIVAFLAGYIPIIVLSTLLLPHNVFIYTSPFKLTALEGVVLALFQVLLVLWGSLVAYLIATEDTKTSTVKIITKAWFIMKRRFPLLFFMVVLLALIAFPFYAIPIGFNLPTLPFALAYLFLGAPASADLLVYGIHMIIFDLGDEIKDYDQNYEDYILPSTDTRTGVDEVLDRVSNSLDFGSVEEYPGPVDKAVYDPIDLPEELPIQEEAVDNNIPDEEHEVEDDASSEENHNGEEKKNNSH